VNITSLAKKLCEEHVTPAFLQNATV